MSPRRSTQPPRRQRRSTSTLQPRLRRLAPSLERWTVFQLERAYAAVRDLAEEALDPTGLNLTQFASLAAIAAHPSISASLVAERVGVRPATMSGTLDLLLEEGLVHCARDPADGRRRLVRLTPLGVETHREGARAIERAEERFLEHLDEYERDDLRAVLRRLEPPEYALGDLYLIGPDGRPALDPHETAPPP